MIPVVLLPLSVHGGCSRYHWIVVAKFTDCWLEQAKKASGKGRKMVKMLSMSKRHCQACKVGQKFTEKRLPEVC